ncbi:uncharacterized protein SOCG_02635 [Schizosaccharomyces octosporus yFS286]|uniref:Fungal protein n=1 Tax=Schizosaccharomyces octosporus (strain yFS286) TaxID=483514 RepID=S9R4Y5_SCHOY|nr:uncharacterized protein SOCG_02635 [Schizosaccharomyces octosporus yFS286]EPX73410.1 fungal protein [Schizosaccharomyces octosporus yFS286]
MPNPGNVAGGYKASLHNPNVSDEAKQHSKEVLEHEDFSRSPTHAKNPGNVAGGYKAALHNPHVSKETKKHDQEVLEELE